MKTPIVLALVACTFYGCLSPRYLHEDLQYLDEGDLVKLVNRRPEQYNILLLNGAEYPTHEVAVPPLYILPGWHEVVYEFRTPVYKTLNIPEYEEEIPVDIPLDRPPKGRCATGTSPMYGRYASDVYTYDIASCELNFRPGEKYTLVKIEKMLKAAGCQLAD